MPPPRLPDDLLAVLGLLEPEPLQRLCDDLLTPAEVAAIGERWEIVKRLAAGESQRAIRDALGVSIATVSRGSRQLRYGSGGFAFAFDALASSGPSGAPG